jgi:hypothetical protein
MMIECFTASLDGKMVVANTTTEENIELFKARGVKTVITTTPRYEGRTFGTNMMEAALTAYAGRGRRLSDEELNGLIDELGVEAGCNPSRLKTSRRL